MCMTAKKQIRAMKRRWPRFRTSIGNGSVVWHGEVQPNEVKYLIQVEALVMRKGRNGALYLDGPVVRVIRPRLELRFDVEEEPLPHVYLDMKAPELSPLCLFDPAQDEWKPSLFIAETIVPWACEWLDCYEMWLATGKWLGGGRHDQLQCEDITR